MNVLNSDILVRQLGEFGVGVAMFLQSSVVPVPWELVIFSATTLGISLMAVALFGGIGVTLGACLGYALGRYGGLPLIERFGKYFFISPSQIAAMERFAVRYGAFSVFFARVLPVVPFKIFSVAAGIIRVPFPQFVICTMLGMVPRIVLVGALGAVCACFDLRIVFGALFFTVFAYYLWMRSRRSEKENA